MTNNLWTAKGPFLVTDALPARVCADMREYLDRGSPAPRSYQGLVDDRLRCCDYVQITDDVLAKQANDLAHAAGDAFGQDLSLVDGQRPLIYRYGVGIGFVTHHDEVTDVEMDRARDNGQPVVRGDVTVTVSLSDPHEYTGGELYFVNPAAEFKPPAGSFVTFPATRTFLHGVREITAGMRYVLLLRFTVQPTCA